MDEQPTPGKRAASEYDKMVAGQWYDANFDAAIRERRAAADDLCWRINQMAPHDPARDDALRDLIGEFGTDVEILGPLYVDYGERVRIGDGCFINHGAYLMDGGGITIGDHVFIGPNLGAYTAIHPLVADERNRGLERALPITIESNVWIGGDVTILPGVTIGAGAVVGAGSVVTKDVPAGVVAAGNPCRVLRPITDADRIEPQA